MKSQELNNTVTETHPLKPLLPVNAKILMLGSFPPPTARWAMDFYYPNFQNDMWRIFGLVFFGDKDRFLADPKHFDKARLEKILREKGVAVADTGYRVRRLKGNASDQYLEIVEKIDLGAILARIPECHAIFTAGEKATSTLLSITGSALPPVGGSADFEYAGRPMRHYRMPSSSRAYPKPLSEKAAVYSEMFRALGMLDHPSTRGE